MSSKEIVLHVGTHKTGTTSIQNFLAENREFLHENDADFFGGRFINSNHVELHVSAMRSDRMSPIKNLFNLEPTEAFVRDTTLAVRSFIDNSSFQKLIFSAEGLSYLRLAGELSALKSIVGEGAVKILMVLRNKADFLRSYTKQLEKMGFAPSGVKDSFAYVKEDSWLIDYDSLVDAYSQVFGRENVIVMNYEDELKKNGSIIPSFLHAAGIRRVDQSYASYWLNKT